MKFALVDGQRQEALPRLRAECPGCGQPVVAKCGNIRVHHWAHQTKRACDHWWENETEWHRAWKNLFPLNWQEVIHQDEQTGERHIADVKTAQGWVIEFQHSYITPEERESRNVFYGKLVWVVDGTRRKTDAAKFLDALNRGTLIAPPNLAPLLLISLNELLLMKDWVSTRKPVFFDFGLESPLWYIHPKISDKGTGFALQVPRKQFVDLHTSDPSQTNQSFEQFISNFSIYVRKVIQALTSTEPIPLQPRLLSRPQPRAPIRPQNRHEAMSLKRAGWNGKRF